LLFRSWDVSCLEGGDVVVGAVGVELVVAVVCGIVVAVVVVDLEVAFVVTVVVVDTFAEGTHSPVAEELEEMVAEQVRGLSVVPKDDFRTLLVLSLEAQTVQ
jgi:hypothetical protein